MFLVYWCFFSRFKTTEEINEKLNGLKLEEHLDFRNHTFTSASDLLIPQSVDWRKNGLVSPVRDQVRNDTLTGPDHSAAQTAAVNLRFCLQGLCGSCWAFSSLGALEGQMRKQRGVLVPLSPQNLVDCSTVDGNLGCRGGYISKAYGYIIRNRGVDSESFYPYEHKVSPRMHERHNTLRKKST